MDLISNLPEAILHHILYFLRSKDVARTSALSKTWRNISSSCPTVNLIQKYHHDNDFPDFMKLSLQNFLKQNLGVRRFKLYVTSYDKKLSYLMDQWINFVANTRVEEVYIEIAESTSNKLPAGRILLASKTLITLSLKGCKLENWNNSISLPNLQKLVLQYLDVDEAFVQNLMLSCPLLDYFRLLQCNELISLDVSTIQRIKTLRVEVCFKIGKVKVATSSLESFRFHGVRYMPCEIDLAASDNLKSLTLINMNSITNEWLQNQIKKSVSLEYLTLYFNLNLETIKISSRSLNKLDIRFCPNLIGEATEIDAPNLHQVTYCDNELPFYSIRSSNLAKVSFSFYLGDHQSVWYHKLKELFQTTSHIQDLMVVMQYSPTKSIITELSDSVLVIMEQVRDWNPYVRISSRTHLLSTCGYEKIYVATLAHDHKSSAFLSAFYEEVSIKKAEAEANQKTDGSIMTCTKKYLDNVEIVSINWAEEEEKEEEEEHKEGWMSLLKAYESALYNITTVKFKWNRRRSRCTMTECKQCE